MVILAGDVLKDSKQLEMHTKVFTSEIKWCQRFALKCQGEMWESWVKYISKMFMSVKILTTKYLWKTGFLNYSVGTD